MRKLRVLLLTLMLTGFLTTGAPAETLELTADRADDIILPVEGMTFYVASGVAVELSGGISGSGPLMKTGPGTLTLSGTNTNTTALIVKEGELIIAEQKALSAGLRYIAVIGNDTGHSAVLELKEALYAGSLVIDIENGGVMKVAGNLQLGGRLRDSVGVINLKGAGSALLCGQQVWLGDEGGYGVLNISDGASMTLSGSNCNMYLGYQSASRGVMRISGEGSVFRTAPNNGLYLGYWGRGELYAADGAELRVGGDICAGYEDGSSALLRLGGPGTLLNSSKSIFIQGRDRDTVTQMVIFDGACVLAGHEVIVASEIGRPSILVEGALLWSYADIAVGQEGDGVLDVMEGGTVVAGYNLNIGDQGHGVMSVFGETTRVYLDNNLYLGNQGRGEVEIGYGAVVFANSGADLGRSKDSVGLIKLEGNAMFYTDYLNVGYYGPGELRVGEGCVVRANRQIWVGREKNAAGVLMLEEYGALYGSDINIGVGGSLEQLGETPTCQEVPYESMRPEFDAARQWVLDLEKDPEFKVKLPEDL